MRALGVAEEVREGGRLAAEGVFQGRAWEVVVLALEQKMSDVFYLLWAVGAVGGVDLLNAVEVEVQRDVVRSQLGGLVSF